MLAAIQTRRAGHFCRELPGGALGTGKGVVGVFLEAARGARHTFPPVILVAGIAGARSGTTALPTKAGAVWWTRHTRDRMRGVALPLHLLVHRAQLASTARLAAEDVLERVGGTRLTRAVCVELLAGRAHALLD